MRVPGGVDQVATASRRRLSRASEAGDPALVLSRAAGAIPASATSTSALGSDTVLADLGDQPRRGDYDLGSQNSSRKTCRRDTCVPPSDLGGELTDLANDRAQPSSAPARP